MKLCDCSYSPLNWSINEKIKLNAYLKSDFISISTNQSDIWVIHLMKLQTLK